MNFCTVSDYNYILKGLALFDSLKNTLNDDFILHYLCMDKKIFDAITKIDDNRLIPILLSDLESIDTELRQAKNNPASKYGTQYSQYCWSLTPYFINYILNNYLFEDEYLIYCDSDIYFYESPQKIIDVINNKSVGIHTHRFGGEYNENQDVGWFNVGVTIFKKDKIGLSISESWKNWLLTTSHPFYQKYGTCGDQKYLELFIRYWKNDVCIFDQNTEIGHLAAWNCSNLVHPKKGYIIYKGVEQKVYFYHFSHFVEDLQSNTWKDHIKEPPEWLPSSDLNIKPYYEDYFYTIKKVNELT